MKTKLLLSLLAVFLGIALISSSNVLAEVNGTGRTGDFQFQQSSETPNPSETPHPSETPQASETPEPSETPRVKGTDRLEGERFRFCQEHEEEVNTRVTSLGDLVANMLGKFDAIATRVEQFYTNVVVPSGKTVPNYAALVADIASKRAAAVTALTNSQADVKGFTCTANNPKGQIKEFRVDMQSVKQALQDYRTSIKNLIVAVMSIVGETEGSPQGSGTPSASASPTVIASPSATPSPVATSTP